ncbi:hypothetical protein [Geodermatophilus sabuli]|uniref:LysM domain-containing protein n=1 Tax=Geodermatophilus sabuli TaxID=1564158 RepID=A0A285EH31_9ACTN|nr:hypothetical protein [Geodermatophilus sabuli]MBB3086089.1 hypothetical protein [Geodermatophilus sabuli]SNX98429.1 hypothetical protein SAMN06893097_110213 [Geodermatophilus sabuli]
MSIRRLLGTAVAMAAVAVALGAVTPDLGAIAAYGLDLQRDIDVRGAETLLLAGVAAVAWGVWAWGVLGLLLTAASAAPGVAGSVARAVTRRLLPAGARRAAAVALGVGLVAGAPLLTACGPGAAHAGPAAATPAAVDRPTLPPTAADWPSQVADWPTAPASTPAPTAGAPAATPPPTALPTTALPTTAPPTTAPPTAAPPSSPDVAALTAPGAVPDWPMPAPGSRVVLRGECLWDIATADLRQRTGRSPIGSEVAAAVHAWWQANAAVIGPDPDVLLPGQVLRPPAAP